MLRSCYLCRKRASRTDNISLHRFPKNLGIRTKWLNACGLTTNNNNVTIARICSRHFRPEDICQSNIFGSVKSSIKRNAVPTLHLNNPLNVDENNKSSETPLSKLFNDNEANQSSFFPDDNFEDECNALDSMKKSPEQYIEVKSIEVNPTISNNSSINADLVDAYEKSNLNLCAENRMTGSSSEGKSTVSDSSQCQKRTFFEPRYVGEISLLDFATPKRAKRTIQLIKTTDKKKSQKIKQLQRQTRNLLKRVQSLQDLINHLKDNHMLSNDSGDAVMV